MGRFTIELEPDQEAWVEQVRRDTELSKTAIMRHLVDYARGETTPAFVKEVEHAEQLRAEIDELDERVARLEQRVPVAVDGSVDAGVGSRNPDPDSLNEADERGDNRQPDTTDTNAGQSDNDTDTTAPFDVGEDLIDTAGTDPDDDIPPADIEPTSLSALPEDLDAQIDALEPKGDEDQQQLRRAGVRAALAFLIERGVASRSDFETFLDRDDVPHGYASSHSAYKNFINGALRDLADGDDRLAPSSQHDPWRWVG